MNKQQLQMTNRDGSRTFAGIYMHDRRLSIIEGTVPEAYPEPSAFTYSLQWLDEKGGTVRSGGLHALCPTARAVKARKGSA